MLFNRRDFLAAVGAGTAGAWVANPAVAQEAASSQPFAMLVDTTQCIGCRKCEWACAQSNQLTDKPADAYEDTTVFDSPRRMKADAYTVVNRYTNPSDAAKPIFVKAQCMHCLKPACASACLVGALHRDKSGAVTYDSWKCMGCRYCMVACPFQVPAYEYSNPLTPVVSKCSFCFERVQKEGKLPACAEMCPPMCLTFAPRDEVLALARQRIQDNPDRYVPHIYGEHEVGGTAWLYLTSRPATELGLLNLPGKPVTELPETLQHSVFKYGIPPLLLFGVLGMAMKTFHPEETQEEHS